jgi:hypothetical protein
LAGTGTGPDQRQPAPVAGSWPDILPDISLPDQLPDFTEFYRIIPVLKFGSFILVFRQYNDNKKTNVAIK